MKLSYLLILALALFIASCNQQETVKNETVANAIEDHQHNESDSIELNNGDKWEVVPEMMQHIRNMESDVNNSNSSEDINYKLLAGKLQKNLDLLTTSCTMEGKAHDELHKWLVPYIDLVDKLNKSKNKEDAQHTFNDIISSFKLFNIYFE